MAKPTYSLIDADTHVTEPEDVWTSRVASKWKDRVPRVEVDAETGHEFWIVDGKRAAPVGGTATAGWGEPFPSRPCDLSGLPPGLP